MTVQTDGHRVPTQRMQPAVARLVVQTVTRLPPPDASNSGGTASPCSRHVVVRPLQRVTLRDSKQKIGPKQAHVVAM